MTMQMKWGLLAALALSLSACGESQPGAASKVQVAAPASYQVAAVATQGCRAPDQPGCAVCYSADVAGCTSYEWSGGRDSDVQPWYNVATRVKGCPHSGPMCARCSLRQEAQLGQLKTQARKVDCSKLPVEIDACMQPNSDACYCSRLRALKQACPSAPVAQPGASSQSAGQPAAATPRKTQP